MGRRDGWLEGVAVIRESDRIGREQAENLGTKIPVRVDPRDAGRARSATMAWAEAVQLGNLTRGEFEQQFTLEVDHGRMDPADAAAARANLDG